MLFLMPECVAIKKIILNCNSISSEDLDVHRRRNV